MSLTLASIPEKEINGNSNTVSKWNAVHHPIVYKFERKDYTVTAESLPISGPSAFETLTVTITTGLPGDASDDFNVGDLIFIDIAGDQGSFLIESIANPDVIVLTNDSGIDFTGIGYINNQERKNYHVKTNIFKVEGVSTLVLIGSSINKPNLPGELSVDVSSFLKSLVDYDDEYDYTTLNIKDETLGGRYNITFSENWTGFEGAESSPLADLNYFTNSAKQIGDLHGSNMGLFVPFKDYDPTDVRAKFLSGFKTPTYFPNFPFSLSFIHSEELDGGGTTLKKEILDVNGNIIATESDALDDTQKPFVNRVLLDGFPNDANGLDVWIINNFKKVTEIKRVKIDNECKAFPLYITWINALGGYSYYLFHSSNAETIQTKAITSYIKNVDDLETSLGALGITGKETSKKIEFGARVKKSDMDGIASLFSSPKVMLLKNPETWETEGVKWGRVLINPGSLIVAQTKIAFHEIKMTMILSPIKTQTE